MKDFLRGLGVGIIMTALLLCISYRNSDSTESVIDRAKELGMVFPENTSKPTITPLETPVSTGSAVTGETSEKPQKEPTTKPTTKPTVKPTTKPTVKPTIKPTTKPTVKPSQEKGTVSFTVREGLLSSSVSREMEEQGIIDDRHEFDDYIEKNGYGKKIRSGKYKIPENATYEEIAKIITRQD